MCEMQNETDRRESLSAFFPMLAGHTIQTV